MGAAACQRLFCAPPDGGRDATARPSAHPLAFDFKLSGNGIASPIRKIASDREISRSTGSDKR